MGYVYAESDLIKHFTEYHQHELHKEQDKLSINSADVQRGGNTTSH